MDSDQRIQRSRRENAVGYTVGKQSNSVCLRSSGLWVANSQYEGIRLSGAVLHTLATTSNRSSQFHMLRPCIHSSNG